MEEKKESPQLTSKGQPMKASASKENLVCNGPCKSTGQIGPVDIWSSQRMLKEFTIYPVTFDPVKLVYRANLLSADSGTNDEELVARYIDAEEEFLRKPFSATDNITGKEINVDPMVDKADDNGYYTIFDPETRQNFVIDPPKLVALDPSTKRELVIDPRKPVGQYYSVLNEQGQPITMDTTDMQPYMYEDPVTGARFLQDDTRMKPFTVIDPKTGAEIRINPLETDGKPYAYVDDQGVGYSVMPVMPGATPVLFENPKTAETSILGGPVLIRDPETGKMKYQEGPFSMRDPKTGESIGQIGPILKTDPVTGEVILMSNPQYVKHPLTGEMILEPSIHYKIQDDGTLVPTLPEAEKEYMKLFKNKGGSKMVWDENLGVFITPKDQEKIHHGKRDHNKKSLDSISGSLSDELILGKGVRLHGEAPSLESLLGNIFNKPDIKRIKKFVETETKDLEETIHTMMSKKKQQERCFMHKLLIDKEKNQNTFIQNLIKYFGNQLKHYDKETFKIHIQDNIREGNEKLIPQTEERIKSDNNKALDAILIKLETEKQKFIDKIVVPQQVFMQQVHEFPSKSLCHDRASALCNEEDPSSNIYFNRAMDVYNQFKENAMKSFNEALHRENEHIRKELISCLEKEKSFIDKRVDELFVKICCEKFLIVK